jgi:hypothetical protein
MILFPASSDSRWSCRPYRMADSVALFALKSKWRNQSNVYMMKLMNYTIAGGAVGLIGWQLV